MDPLADIWSNIDIQSFDIARIVSIYPDKVGYKWWTKAWFNNKKKGEDAIEITRQQVSAFLNDELAKDAWLEKFYPRQMQIYHQAIEQTKQQINQQYNL